MVLEHYKTYLRAELGKLRGSGDAAKFLASGNCDVQVVSPPLSVRKLVEAFASQKRVDDYVFSLSDEDLIGLTWCCDQWRHNHIARDLSPHQVVEIVDVPVSKIVLRQAEPRLGPMFESHGWRLTGIAQDPSLLAEPEYRNHLPGELVAVPVCIAKPDANESDMFRVIDGIHRAIQLFRNGQETIRLCVIRDL